MKYFNKLAEGIDVNGLLNAVMRQPELWNQNNIRTRYKQSPHSQAEDILLRFNPIPADDITKLIDDVQCVNFPAFNKLPQARPIIFSLMRTVEGEQLGRVMITKLSPGKRITPHVDEGAPANFYDRYHAILQNLPGSLFRAGDETVQMRTGEVWWFDNKQEHEVINNSFDDRLTMIIDIRTFR